MNTVLRRPPPRSPISLLTPSHHILLNTPSTTMTQGRDPKPSTSGPARHPSRDPRNGAAEGRSTGRRSSNIPLHPRSTTEEPPWSEGPPGSPDLVLLPSPLSWTRTTIACRRRRHPLYRSRSRSLRSRSSSLARLHRPVVVVVVLLSLPLTCPTWKPHSRIG